MTVAALIVALEVEQAKAQRAVDACAAAIAAFRLVLDAEVPRTPPAAATTPKAQGSRPKPAQPKPAKPSTPAAASPAPPSKSGRYRAVIEKFLGRGDIREHGADTAVIRRHVAKECDVDPAKDDRFGGDVQNALYVLRQAGTVSRVGTMWTLVAP